MIMYSKFKIKHIFHLISLRADHELVRRRIVWLPMWGFSLLLPPIPLRCLLHVYANVIFTHTLNYTVNHQYLLGLVLENGRLSDRYRIGTDTGCIVSNNIGYCCIGRYYVHQCRFINCGRIALHTMIKGRSSDPSPALRARTRACCFMVHDTGEGWRGGKRKETVT